MSLEFFSIRVVWKNKREVMFILIQLGDVTVDTTKRELKECKSM
jgi:hypothetical protein